MSQSPHVKSLSPVQQSLASVVLNDIKASTEFVRDTITPSLTTLLNATDGPSSTSLDRRQKLLPFLTGSEKITSGSYDSPNGLIKLDIVFFIQPFTDAINSNNTFVINYRVKYSNLLTKSIAEHRNEFEENLRGAVERIIGNMESVLFIQNDNLKLE